MLLRDHPLMTYRGVRNWPPIWIGRNTKRLDPPRGEIGILKNVILPKTGPLWTCSLMIEHEGEDYLGALLFDDQLACDQVYGLLLGQRGEPIRKIGEIDIPDRETPIIIPLRRRMCKACGWLDNCDFKVVDDVWRTAVPIEYQTEILCRKCFEVFASEKQIELLRPKG